MPDEQSSRLKREAIEAKATLEEATALQRAATQYADRTSHALRVHFSTMRLAEEHRRQAELVSSFQEAARVQLSVMEELGRALDQHVRPIWPSLARAIDEQTKDIAAVAHASVFNSLAALNTDVWRTSAAEAMRTTQLSGLSTIAESFRAQQLSALGAAGAASTLRLSDTLADHFLSTRSAAGAFAASLRSLDKWTRSFSPDFLDRVEVAIQEEVSEEPEQSIVTAVTSAVMRAVSEIPQHVDWKFIVGIILTLIIFFYQKHESAATDRELADISSHIEDLSAKVSHQVAAQDEILRMLLTRDIDRPTRLRAKPKSQSRVLAYLSAEIPVVIMARKGKWTRVGVRAEDSPTGETLNGWLLNKYLR